MCKPLLPCDHTITGYFIRKYDFIIMTSCVLHVCVPIVHAQPQALPLVCEPFPSRDHTYTNDVVGRNFNSGYSNVICTKHLIFLPKAT